MSLTLNHYLFASGMLFSIGFAGVLLRRNIIIIFMALELMLNAANLSLVAFSRFNVGANGLPMGMQLIGRPQADLDVLRIARACEQRSADTLSRRPPALG